MPTPPFRPDASDARGGDRAGGCTSLGGRDAISCVQKIGSSHPEEVPLSTGEAATKIQNRFRTNQVRKQFQGRRRR